MNGILLVCECSLISYDTGDGDTQTLPAVIKLV